MHHARNCRHAGSSPLSQRIANGFSLSAMIIARATVRLAKLVFTSGARQSRVNASTKPIMRIARPLAVLHNSSCFSSSSLSWLLRISYRCLLRRLSTLVAYFRWGFLGCDDRQVNVPFDLGTVQAANPHSP